ncbi:hypothetical protein XELAEV_18024727mg [Xenopus laevis]|uniref:Uncharacterized protein n=1 Tax=Xenopus laevis TaxID=8355 RepID=A0A974CYA7_XENLA|nr:hypothetical protein XELAEV_18024727mg [Xenopus laevis]
MADLAWEGWAEEEGQTGTPLFSDADIDVDFGLRYIWAGTYGEKLNVHFNRIVVPYCGHCTSELSTETCNFHSSCPYCFHECWLGLYVLYADPKKGIKTKSIATNTDGLSSVSGDSAPAPVPAYPPYLSSVRPPTIQSLPIPLKALSISQPEGVGASRDAATQSQDPRVPPRGRGSVMRRNPDTITRPATPRPTTVPKDEASSTVVPTVISSSQQPVACLSKPLLSPEEQGFWVSQGRADPKKARTVSQWVYDEVEKNLEEWLYGELLKKTDVGPKGLFQSNPQKRQRDMVFLCDTLSKRWYGYTILKHHVKSCGKFQEDRFFSLTSTLPNGGKVEKPHPSYYLSYEDTLKKYGVNV